MYKPLIVLSASHEAPESSPVSAGLGLTYINAIEENGGVALLASGVPASVPVIAAKADGLLLSGGCDVDPKLYGQEMNGTKGIDARRDAFEIALCLEMIRLGKPVLGICRGIQVLNVALGGTLIQDIPSWLGLEHPAHRDVRHTVEVLDGSVLNPEIHGTWTVNSTHHQSVDKPGKGLRIVATSENGRINEAVEAVDGRPIWGVQWHPERHRLEDASMDSIFRKLILAAGK